MISQDNQSLEKRPYILVSNDDGINSPGIYAIVQKLKQIGEVIVIAPEHEQSAVGHSLTISRPLRVTKVHRNGEMFGYAVSGSPSDCVKLALCTYLERKPDIIVSGINHGQNTAINVLYSGTVSAATEGMLFGIKSIAFSVCSHDREFDIDYASDVALEITKKALEYDFPKDTLLNVNIPATDKLQIKGTKITKVGNGYWKDFYIKRQDPFNRDYYWFSGEYFESDDSLENDDIAVKNGYISVTPVKYTLTSQEVFEHFKNFE
ncbi:MAG: 5'/3'-nucleotidase SurE [Ignavibacteria bacterium GWF2_33_9]|nr:MAG: 5'/3'-nucleotidase SurE [Ignavibacteria bacterium GWF2_33_9]